MKTKAKRFTAPHERVFAKPARLSKMGRHQVGVTQGIRDYVAGFRGKTLLERAKAIVADVAKFRVVEMPFDEAKKHWVQRSADEIIKTKTIYVAAKLPMEPRRIAGCSDYSQAACAALRAINLRVAIVRAGTHSYVKFLYKGEIYMASPAALGPKVGKITPDDLENERRHRDLNMIAEGASPADIGLRSFKDFFRYRKPLTRRRVDSEHRGLRTHRVGN